MKHARKLAFFSLLLPSLVPVGAVAQSWQLNGGSYALKSDESVEVGDVYYVLNCRSLLTGTPEVTILDGPPGVTAAVVDAQVTPRLQQCAKPVKGGKLVLKADKIEDQSQTVMTIRVKYKTKDGDREKSLTFGMSLFP